MLLPTRIQSGMSDLMLQTLTEQMLAAASPAVDLTPSCLAALHVMAYGIQQQLKLNCVAIFWMVNPLELPN